MCVHVYQVGQPFDTLKVKMQAGKGFEKDGNKFETATFKTAALELLLLLDALYTCDKQHHSSYI